MANEFTGIPTNIPYQLRCKIEIKRIQTQDLGKVFERQVAFLIPEINDQAERCFSAWLPDLAEPADKYYEIAMYLGSPINAPCRGAIQRRNAQCQEHHIFVMSKGVEDYFIDKKMNGTLLRVKVLPESMEAEAEAAPDSGGDYDIV